MRTATATRESRIRPVPIESLQVPRAGRTQRARFRNAPGLVAALHFQSRPAISCSLVFFAHPLTLLCTRLSNSRAAFRR